MKQEYSADLVEEAIDRWIQVHIQSGGEVRPVPVSLMLQRTVTSPGAQEIDRSTEQIVWKELDVVNWRALPRRFMSILRGQSRIMYSKTIHG